MKRKVLSIFAAVFFSGIGFSFAQNDPQNGQEIIPLEDPLYRFLDDLCMESGFAPPSGSRPYSAQEARGTLSLIPYESLSEAGKSAFRAALDRLSQKPLYREGEVFAFLAKAEASIEAYSRFPLNQESLGLGSGYQWKYGYERRLPLLKAPLGLWFGDFGYSVFELKLIEEYHAIDNRFAAGKENLAILDNHWNLPAKLTDFDTFFPFRGYLSFGSENANLEFGRDALSWGNGLTGNLILSDYTDYYDFVRASLFTRYFKFASIYTVFRAKDMSRYEALTAHRLEFRPFDICSIALTEAMAIGGSASGIFENLIHDLNPVTIYHNWLAPNRANSILGLEASVNPYKFVTLYGQAVVDEFETQAETEAGATNQRANAFGWIAGCRASLPLGEGYLRANFEFAETDPWLYNRYQAPYYRSTRRIWSFITPAFDEWVIKPTGYKYGPDSIVWHGVLEYEYPRIFRLALSFDAIIQGENTLFSSYPAPGSPLLSISTPSGVRETNYVLSLFAAYSPLPWLSLRSVVSWNLYDSYAHVAGTTTSDLETSLGLTVSL